MSGGNGVRSSSARVLQRQDHCGLVATTLHEDVDA
jgi:hypothetical protein